jgi:tetratricopeptide (TPR) repeat protein
MTTYSPVRMMCRLALVAWLGTIAACAAKTAPPPPVGTAPSFPDFVFPAPGADLDAATAGRQRAAWAWLQSGDLRTAEREFNAILNRRPQFAPAESGLGYVLLARRQPDDAFGRFNSALKHAPAYAPALAGRAQALLALGRDAEALANLEAAAAADPSLDLGPRIEVLRFRSAEDRIAAARRAAEQGHLDEARAAYAQAIAQSPESAFLFRELAAVDQRAGQIAPAIEHVQRALSLDPSDAKAQVLLGDLRAGQSDYQSAAAAYAAAQAIDANPEVAAKLDDVRRRAAVARLPAEYHAIPGLAEVTRGDVAAVLGVTLASLLGPAGDRPGVLVTDVRTHWASTWIIAVVRAGVMEPLPNHTFQPQQPVRRVDLAQIVGRVLALIAARRPAAGAEWQAARVKMADLSPSHPTYPAASQAVAAGVLPLAGDAFQPARPVSGAELVGAADRLALLASAGPAAGVRRR